MQMAIQLTLCFLVLLASQSVFVMGRNDFYHYFFSHYHKGSSTTEVPRSSITGPFTTEVLQFSTTGQTETRHEDNAIDQQHDEPFNPDDFYDRAITIRRIVLIIFGSIMGASLLMGCCCFVCCNSCRKGREQKGYIISSNINSTQQMPYMQQPVQYVSQQAPYTQQSQHAPTLQHVPPERQLPEFPPPYNTQAVQPQQHSAIHWQPQHSPTQQERQFSPVNQQMPAQPLIELDVPPTAPTGYEKF